jgi:hypothetical protein
MVFLDFFRGFSDFHIGVNQFITVEANTSFIMSVGYFSRCLY